MGCKRIELYVRHEEIPGEDVRDRFRGLVRRRASGEPVAYLVGHKEFFSLDFLVSPAVLIPRPDTETLVDQALRDLKARALPAPTALDLGTGSGCLAIVLAKLVPTLSVTAVDLSREALEIAGQNAKRNKVDNRVQFLCGDLFHPLKDDDRFDLLVSNPPYIPSGDIAGLEPTVRDFEPKSALDGGADGLDFYRRILGGAPKHLHPQGRVMVEVGIDQAEAVASLARAKGFVQVAIVADMGRIPRVVVGRLA
jgi:release factor glutamine methyltransferase